MIIFLPILQVIDVNFSPFHIAITSLNATLIIPIILSYFMVNINDDYHSVLT